MNFFEQQDRARRRTTRLVVMFVVAVVLTVVDVNIAVFFILNATGAFKNRRRSSDSDRQEQFDRQPIPRGELFALTTGITLLIIVGGSVYKIMLLSRGGPAVAELLGGRPLD